MPDLWMLLSALAGLAVRHYAPALWPILAKLLPALGSGQPKPDAQPAPGAAPVQPAPAAPPAHPLLDAILARVLGLALKQKAGTALTAAEQSELRATLPVAQSVIAEAALLQPPAK